MRTHPDRNHDGQTAGERSSHGLVRGAAAAKPEQIIAFTAALLTGIRLPADELTFHGRARFHEPFVKALTAGARSVRLLRGGEMSRRATEEVAPRFIALRLRRRAGNHGDAALTDFRHTPCNANELIHVD